MNSFIRLISFIFGLVVFVEAANLPSFITPCSRRLPSQELSECITTQAKSALPKFAAGLTELNLEPFDPLSVADISVKAGTFAIRSTNVVVKGLRKIELKDMKWDLDKKSGHMKLYGNFTFLSDYETDGRVLLIPITGNGKLTVKMYNTELLIKFKIKMIQGPDGVEHMQTYDLKPSQTYGNVKIHLTNLLGGAVLGDTINQVLNENWRDLIEEVGPPFITAASSKVHEVINKFYAQVPFDELITP